MKIKSYIAVFFALVFLGKFFMLDAKFFGSILESEDTSWVNTFCKNTFLNFSEENKPADFEQSSNILVINAEAICNSPFNFSNIYWPAPQAEPNFQYYDYRNPAVISAYHDKFYPPPKVLIA
ncbi:hypothetical protein [Salegentibacter sediminis]|uniref:hypothetical protein n=1 Tax=Salegentibacter sediminis TaxID=1930251 RepID=UPI0009BF9C01|nr:hypothetical protein [Salegentibacter sediminis]